MTTKATHPEMPAAANVDAFDHVVLIAIPDETYRALADEATRRGLRVSQAIKAALEGYLANKPYSPQLLTEGA